MFDKSPLPFLAIALMEWEYDGRAVILEGDLRGSSGSGNQVECW